MKYLNGACAALALICLPAQASLCSGDNEKRIALATGSTPFELEHQQQNEMTADCRSTQAAAEEAALAQCKAASPDADCKVVHASNKGCAYIDNGTHPSGRAGWGIGATPQAAYDSCHANGFNCRSSPIGGCSNPAKEQATEFLIPEPNVHYWFALAIGSESDGHLANMVRGTSAGMDQSDAEDLAQKECELTASRKGWPITCKAVSSYNQGCGYVAFGAIPGGHGQTRWSVRTTKEEAVEACRAAGADCPLANVLGGCVRD